MEGIDNGNSVGTKVQAGEEDKIRTTLSKKDQNNWLFLVKCGSTILASLAGVLLYKEFTYLIRSLLP